MEKWKSPVYDHYDLAVERLTNLDGSPHKRRGTDGDSSASAQQNLHRTISTYTEHRHRALIALRCAASHRPFNEIEDNLYLEEIEMLRPGTIPPSASTVSRDLQTLYQKGSILVVEYFSVCFLLLHTTNF